MPDRFWVGGGANTGWTATGNTNWAATSGGANNASVPGVGDRVIFDANSGTGTAAISNNITVQSVNCTGYTGIITHGAFTLTLNTAAVDTFLLVAGMTYTPSASTSVVALTHTSGTADLTLAGKRLGGLTINGAGGTTRLLDALRVDFAAGSTLTLTAGAFNANNFNVTATIFNSSNSNTRTLTMGSGTWTIGATAVSQANIWTTSTATNLTFNKDTANIVVPTGVAGVRYFLTGGLTFNGLTIDSNSSRGAIAFTGSGTFSSWTIGAGNVIEIFGGTTMTVSTAFSLTGTPSLPVSLRTSSVGIVGTISVPSGSVSMAWGAVRDITFSGGASFSSTNTLDLGNNTGMGFSAPSVPLDAAAIRDAIGLASANLDTQLSTIDDFLDTEITAIKAKTDLIPGTQDGKTFAELTLLMASVLLGKASGLDTATAIFRAVDDSKSRVTATVDGTGNRTAVTLDAA